MTSELLRAEKKLVYASSMLPMTCRNIYYEYNSMGMDNHTDEWHWMRIKNGIREAYSLIRDCTDAIGYIKMRSNILLEWKPEECGNRPDPALVRWRGQEFQAAANALNRDIRPALDTDPETGRCKGYAVIRPEHVKAVLVKMDVLKRQLDVTAAHYFSETNLSPWPTPEDWEKGYPIMYCRYYEHGKDCVL